MIIKRVDDVAADIAVLRGLMSRPDCSDETRSLIAGEIETVRTGTASESEATQELNLCFGSRSDWMVIHDLCIERGSNNIHIDHLVLNRWLDIWVCDSKGFSEDITLEKDSGFDMFFDNRYSPSQKNYKHIKMLQRLFDQGIVELPTILYMSLQPALHNLVLVSRNVWRNMDEGQVGTCIRVDQVACTITRQIEGYPLPFIGQDELWKLAFRITGMHRTPQHNWARKFGFEDPDDGCCRDYLPMIDGAVLELEKLC